MESFVHPRSRGTSVNKRRNIFLTRPPPLPRYCSERGIQIFKHENIRGRHLHELCIRRVHRRVSGPHCSPLCSLRRLFPPPLSSLFLRFFLGPFSRNPCFLLRRLTNFYQRRSSGVLRVLARAHTWRTVPFLLVLLPLPPQIMECTPCCETTTT